MPDNDLGRGRAAPRNLLRHPHRRHRHHDALRPAAAPCSACPALAHATTNANTDAAFAAGTAGPGAWLPRGKSLGVYGGVPGDTSGCLQGLRRQLRQGVSAKLDLAAQHTSRTGNDSA